MEVLNRIDIPASQGRRKSEDIVAWPAAENISAALSIETIIAEAAADVVRAGVAGDDVVKLLASGIDVGAAGQHDLLDVLADGGVADRRENLVRIAAAGGFDRHVAGIVDDVMIVAAAPRHRVGAGAAIEQFAAGARADRFGRGRDGDIELITLPGADKNVERILDDNVVGARRSDAESPEAIGGGSRSGSAVADQTVVLRPMEGEV